MRSDDCAARLGRRHRCHSPYARVPVQAAGKNAMTSETISGLTNDVHTRLRGEIMRGELKPHQTLVEVELAARLGVSRTPIRESLQRLRSEGLVVSERRRWVVYAHTRREIEEIFEVRMALEGYAARLACARASDAQKEEIEAIFLNRNDDDLSVPEFVKLNSIFHAAIVRSSGNLELESLVSRNLAYGFNVRLSATYSRADIHLENDEHRKLAGYLVQGADHAAEQLARDHIRNALDLALERLVLG